MSFFDNLGKKASETTAKAVQKAQELAEISRINSLISDEEKKINTTYYQIGKLYVSVHGGDGETDFTGMVSTVLEGEQKINEYRRQIQDIKGVQRCEKCGAEVARGSAFCSSCGAPMPKAEEPVSDDAIRCENCGTMVKRGMRFCTSVSYTHLDVYKRQVRKGVAVRPINFKLGILALTWSMILRYVFAVEWWASSTMR